MKNELMIVGMSLILVLTLSFVIFTGTNNGFSTFFGERGDGVITVFAIENGTTSVEEEIEETNYSTLNITRELALEAIVEGEEIIEWMKQKEFSTWYVEDTLIEAKRTFEQAEYASILRGDVNASSIQEQEARKALALIKWNNIYYKEVINHTNAILNRKNKALLLSDRLKVSENRLTEANSNETHRILDEAKLAFKEDRYGDIVSVGTVKDVEILLEEFEESFENDIKENSQFNSLRTGAKNFFQRYWVFILILLIGLIIGGYFSYKGISKKLLKQKIRKMETEKGVLFNLMKRAQVERFKKNTISGLVYNIKMKKYRERIQKIKEELPVLEARLNKVKTLKTKKH